MPYIKQLQRDALEKTLRPLLALVPNLSAGELNYVISNIIWKANKDDKSYASANELIGVLECAKLEFYRRQVAALEEQAIIRNGDLEI